MQYLILQHPGHNRVYYNHAGRMAVAELQLVCSHIGQNCDSLEIIELSGIRYLSFRLDEELNDAGLKIISRLSFIFALFRVEEIKGESVLIPVKLEPCEYIDRKISSILKYQGKTNELFTRMMINVAYHSSIYTDEENITLLDPVAGRGTTLFEAAVYGYNAYGIEIDSKHTAEAILFFKKHLESERLKHKLDKRRVAGKNKNEALFIQEFEYALDKVDFGSVEKRKKLGIINAETIHTASCFNKKLFHLIVGDLPYGIKHTHSSEHRKVSGTRSPVELLEESLPSWYTVLKEGGVIVLAWNAFLASRKKMTEIFEKHQLHVMDEDIYQEFEHMVDKAIKRDIIVAVKQGK